MKLIVICQICFMMMKCIVRTLCISMHHAFIVCIPSAFLWSVHNLRPGGGGGGGLSKLVAPPKNCPCPSRIHGIHGKQIAPPTPPPTPMTLYENFCPPPNPPPHPAYFISMPLCDCYGPTTALIHVMSLSPKKIREIMH